MDGGLGLGKNLVDATEDSVNLGIAATVIPPALDNSLVVAVHKKVKVNFQIS